MHRLGDNFLLETSFLGRNVPSSASPNFAYNKTVSPSDTLSKRDVKVGGNYSCEICNRTDINSEAELTAHKKLHHAKSKLGTVSLQCAYCNEHCKSRSDLENHMKSHQIACGKGKHKCNICDEIFSSNGTLAEHKLSHCKIVAGNSCTQCKTVLVDESSFYNHQLQHSNTVVNKSNAQMSLPANCIICCQTLQTDVEIKLHAKFHLRHLLQKDYICAVCNKVSQNITIKHIEKNNSHIPINICKECLVNTTNGTFSPQNEQQNKANFACMKCPPNLEGEDDMQNHKDHEETNLECHLCRNVMLTPAKLQIHLIEHNFMGMGQYRCYVCSSVFTTAGGLRNHIIGHGLNHRPYECNDCKMKFFFKTELENHKYIHMLSQNGYDCKNNLRQYVECKNCSVSFPEDLYYTEHITTCKSEEPSKDDIKQECVEED